MSPPDYTAEDGGVGAGCEMVPSESNYDVLTAGVGAGVGPLYDSLDYKNTTVQRSDMDFRVMAHELEADIQIGHHFLEMTCGCCSQIFKIPIGCGDALCTACGKLRQMRYSPMMMEAIKATWARGNIAAMVTVPLKNSFDLVERLDKLIWTMRQVRHRRSNRARRAVAKRPEWCAVMPEYYGVWGDHVRAGAYSIEVTFNPESGYHVHAHILVEMTSYLDQAALSEELHDVSGDSYIVDIRQIKNGGQAHKEISKYPFKPADEKYLSDSQRSEVRNALRGRRLFTFFGSMYGEHTLSREPGECPGCGEVGTLFASAVNDRWGDRKQLDWLPVTASPWELEYARRWGTVQVALDGGAVPNWGGGDVAGGGRLVGEWARWKGRLRAG